MKKYLLETKIGEIIATIEAESIEQAQEFFAIIKILSINDLLKIFIVLEDPKK